MKFSTMQLQNILTWCAAAREWGRVYFFERPEEDPFSAQLHHDGVLVQLLISQFGEDEMTPDFEALPLDEQWDRFFMRIEIAASDHPSPQDSYNLWRRTQACANILSESMGSSVLLSSPVPFAFENESDSLGSTTATQELNGHSISS